MRHVKFENNRPKLTKIIIVNQFEKYFNWLLQPYSFGFRTYYNNKIHMPNSIGLLYHVYRAESKRGHVKSV